MLLLLMAGCSWFEDKRVVKSRVRDPELYQAVLRTLIIKTKHPEWTINELLAEIEYQRYLISLGAEDGRLDRDK